MINLREFIAEMCQADAIELMTFASRQLDAPPSTRDRRRLRNAVLALHGARVTHDASAKRAQALRIVRAFVERRGLLAHGGLMLQVLAAEVDPRFAIELTALDRRWFGDVDGGERRSRAPERVLGYVELRAEGVRDSELRARSDRRIVGRAKDIARACAKR